VSPRLFYVPSVDDSWEGGCVKKTRKRHAVGELKDGPSESPHRWRLQTAMSCVGQKPRWLTSMV